MANFHEKPNTFVSQVHLIVEDLKRSLKFYQEMIGFQVLEQTDRIAQLTADGKTTLITIEQPESVIPKSPRTTGLYHFALLLPTRKDLGKMIKHLAQSGYPLQGGSDHYVSEALYLADPDGNGIEIYSDRPASSWKWQNGEVVMTTEPMDVESLLAEAAGEPWEVLPKDTLMGHIHLHVSELQKTEEFYCEGLGFDVVAHYGSQALFISTGGYHHHIGLNTWNGVGAPSSPENSAGMKFFTLVYPDEETRDRAVDRLEKLNAWTEVEKGNVFTKDPSGNMIQLVVSG